MKIVLESDGTEVDEEEYFSTLEQNTCFMILKENEDWIPPSEYNYLLVWICYLGECWSAFVHQTRYISVYERVLVSSGVLKLRYMV